MTVTPIDQVHRHRAPLWASGNAAVNRSTSSVRFVRTLVLLAGPLASVVFISSQQGRWGAALVAAGMWVTLAFWTPFAPITFPALILQDARDDALVGLVRPVRALVLVPWLALARRSAVKLETWANLVGCVCALYWVVNNLPA